MSNWGNYIVPDFLQQDITVDYLAATTHQAAAATLLCLSELAPCISAEVRWDAERAQKQVGLAVIRRQNEQPVKCWTWLVVQIQAHGGFCSLLWYKGCWGLSITALKKKSTLMVLTSTLSLWFKFDLLILHQRDMVLLKHAKNWECREC